MNTNLKVKLLAHNTSADFRCVLCGERYEQNFVAAQLLTPDINFTELFDSYGDICPTCLDFGQAGASERTRAYANKLRSRADWLDGLANEIPFITEWATSADIQRAEKQNYEAMAAYIEGRPIDETTLNNVTLENSEYEPAYEIKIVQPVWDELQAMEYILDNNQTPPEQRKEFLDELDKIHDALLNAVENVEQLANQIQVSLP